MVKKSKKAVKKTETISKKKTDKTSSKSNSNIDFGLNIAKYAIPLILILFVMWFAFFVRSGPINLNGLDDRIEANTYSQIQSIVSQQMEINYGTLKQKNPTYFQELVDAEYKKVIESGKINYGGQTVIIKDLVKQNQEYIKSAFQSDDNQTYLNAIDPYHFLFFASNFYETGTTGDSIVNGIPWVTKKLSPIGYKGTENPQFHVWLESKLFSFDNLDKENSTISQQTKSIYLIPVFLAMIAGIAIFFILRRFSNDLFALFGSLLLVSIGTFVSRTVAGFVDTDGYVVLFPLLISVFLIYAFVYNSKYITIFLATIAGLFQGLFLWAWSPGWFIFIFSITSLIGYLAYLFSIKIFNKIKNRDFEIKITNDLLTLFSFIISSVLFTYLFIKKNIFYLAVSGLLGSQDRFATIGSNIWPNVFSSVAELNPASFGQIVSGVGSNFIFIIALLGVLFLTLDFKTKNINQTLIKRGIIFSSILWFLIIVLGNAFVSLTANMPLIFLALLFLPIGIALLQSLLNNNKNSKIFLAILLTIWMAGTIYMSLNGVRFILLLAPAFAISFGLGLYYLSNIINTFFTKEFNISNIYGKILPGFIVITLLFITLFTPVANQAITISDQTLPNFDDAWYDAMYKIKDNSQENAIITSWWDFGHFFATVSERGTTFDGGSQTTPRSHWVGKLLLENDEEKAHDILRMLVCGGNEAHNTFLSFTAGNTDDAVKINKVLYKTFGKNLEDTRNIIKNNKYYDLTNEQTDQIMNYLACQSPVEDFLITSEDMVGKAGVWAHWGSWDFTKKYVYDNYKKDSASQISKAIDENITLIQTYIEELKSIEIKANQQDIKKEDLINQWLAPYPSYIPIKGQYSFPCTQQNTTLVCQNGISVDMQSGQVTSQFGSDVKFANVYFPTNTGDIQGIKIGDGNIDILIVASQTGFSSILMQTPLGNSLFTRLFYLDGFGTKYFEKFDEKQSATGVKIKTWKVIWDLNETQNNTNTLKVNSVQFNASKEQVQDIIGEELNSTN